MRMDVSPQVAEQIAPVIPGWDNSLSLRMGRGIKGAARTAASVFANRPGYAQLAVQGAFSSVIPMPAITAKQMGKLGLGDISSWSSKVAEKYGKRSARAIGAKALGYAGATLGALIGPVQTAYRLGTELDQVQGAGNKISKVGRIIGEEVAWGAGMGLGMGAGAAAGAAIGSALGTAVPIVGNILGFIIGGVLGYIGSKGVNTAFDIMEAPIRAGARVWENFEAIGRQAKKAHLGGQISAGNRSRIAATMRQRGLMQMQRSGINMRSLLGREASMVHMR